MRDDMAKVVTESPRRGHGERNRKSRARIHRDQYDADDHGPTRKKMSRLACRDEHSGAGDCHKDFSDKLGPLRKYLRKQVGRPWNNIYSELRQHLDFRTVSGLHIWDHVKHEVELHCEERADRKVYRKGVGHYYHLSQAPISGMYVHPRTGLLCYAKETRRRYRKPVDHDVVKLDKFNELRRVDGIWYALRFGAVDVYVPEQIHKFGNTTMVKPAYWREQIVQQSKKQLSRVELRRHKLSNV